MYDRIKIVDLNPVVPEDQIYELLCEKFSNYPDVNINIVQQDKSRIAYLYFKDEADARAALKQNSCIALFGYACRAVPVYDKLGPSVTGPSDDDYFETADESFRKSDVDRERASVSSSERSPQRQPNDYRWGRGFRGARWSGRRAGRQRGFGSSRARGRGSKPYFLTRTRGYFLTKSRDKDERKSDILPAAHDKDAVSTFDETNEKEPNSTLYIGSLDPSVKVLDLKRLFNSFGYVLDVEIKTPSATVSFAFVHFLTVDMACLAKQEMTGKPIGRTVPKLGYGREVESLCLWVGGLGPWTSEDMLRLEFAQFGTIKEVKWPRNRDYAYILFADVQDAIDAKQVMHRSHHGDPPHRIRVSYASNLQMISPIHDKPEFPKFPRLPRPESQPKNRMIPHSGKAHFPHKRKSHDQESQDSRRRRRGLSERSRSHSRTRSRSRTRKTHSRTRSRRKERTPSPYARSISQASDMSAISETSSESVGSPERNRQRKRRKKSPVSKSPAGKLLRNPSPPKSVMKDERTVVLRSEPLPVTAASGAASSVLTSVVSQLQTAAVPSYVHPVDPVAYYPTVASTLPPTMFPPPMHIPPPDFYMPPNPVIPQFTQHLPPLVSYPPLATDSAQHVPIVSQSSLPPIQTNTYLPSSTAEKLHQDAAPAKDMQKPAIASVAAKFPKIWSGALVLRNAAFVVDFHLLSGSVLLVNSLLGNKVEPGTEADCPVLKIAQRLRLDQPDKLDELDRRLKKAGRTSCSVLLATSTPAQVDDDANVVQQHPLSSLVSYLLQKQVAAVVSLPPGTSDAAKATGVLHAFPPCQYASDFLHREAPGLPDNCPTKDELLVVLCEL